MKKYPKYFQLSELLASATAIKKKIANLPSFDIVENLRQLGLFLDGIREAWGSGIGVSSGYRCDKLNKAVGGVKNSSHRTGFASDIYPLNGKMDEFETFLKEYLKDKDFDECLWESDRKTGGRWVHISIKSIDGEQRHKMFGLVVK